MQLFGRDKEPLKAVCAGMGFIYSGKAQLTKQFLQLWGSYVDPFIPPSAPHDPCFAACQPIKKRLARLQVHFLPACKSLAGALHALPLLYKLEEIQ